jgi:hypothetical protein
MAASETLVQVVLVFAGGRSWSVQAYADGFELRAWEDGESGQFRHWPLGRGWIGTTADNEIREIGARACAPGPVPVPEGARPLQGEVEARLGWPAEVVGRMERRGDELIYEVQAAPEAPDAWFAIGEAAWLGVSPGASLSRIVARAGAPARERVELRVPGDRYAAALSAGRFLQVEREPSGVAEGWPANSEVYGRHGVYEAARGNASLSVGRDGALANLRVYDVVGGEGVGLDLDAPLAADGVHGWQEWPADVRASSWRDGDDVWVSVRFGATPAETWRRTEHVWVGTQTSGEIAAIVFRAEDSGPPFRREAEDEDAAFGELPPLRRTVEEFDALPFTVYGLAGEIGAPGGFGSGFANVISSLDVTFGAPEGNRWLTVTSSREADLDLVRLNVVSDLIPPDDDGPEEGSRAAMEEWFALERERAERIEREIFENPWLPVAIPVDGEAVEWWSTRHGDRWAAITRVGVTTIALVGQGYEPGEVVLERITDLEPHAEHARRQARERLAPMLAQPARPERSPEERARRASVRRVVAGLTDAMHNNAGSPELGDLFTPRVVDAWGGRRRYRDLLWLHTMLRPVTGSGTTGDSPRFNADGSADMWVSIQHAAVQGDRGSTAVVRLATAGGTPEPEPEPDRAAIDRGEPHRLALRLVPDGDGWLIDTDLLAVLIDRIGPIDHVVQPFSRQGGGGPTPA